MRAFWAAAERQPVGPFLIAGVLSGLGAMVLAIRVFEKRVGMRP